MLIVLCCRDVGTYYRPEVYDSDGLNTLNYTVVSRQDMTLYTRILVNLPDKSSATRHGAPWRTSMSLIMLVWLTVTRLALWSDSGSRVLWNSSCGWIFVNFLGRTWKRTVLAAIWIRIQERFFVDVYSILLKFARCRHDLPGSDLVKTSSTPK